ncbi:hypothetical protein [Acuticoccus sp. I52.16.1]|uniref:hypothetical protein n=1 Tax=Acuticoccus sp. I52.16.1 TaxID=2928472 RepID=UPI001FD0D063|nr:hypothetical protein [Acuticoccus sp. I52.16.1]UOM34555.1 hypothetical protein MRB58_22535 [Acuticoccus sp. I52.16.1]
MRFVLGAVLALGLAGMVQAQDTRSATPETMTLAFIEAYKARDLAAILPLMNDNNRAYLTKVAARGEDHPTYRDIFTGWRAEAVDAATGPTGDTRYRPGGEAMVPIGAAGDEVFVVAFTRAGDVWGIEDVLGPDAQDFEALPTRP